VEQKQEIERVLTGSADNTFPTSCVNICSNVNLFKRQFSISEELKCTTAKTDTSKLC